MESEQPPFSCIVDFGNGFQAYKFIEPYRINGEAGIAELRRRNLAISQSLNKKLEGTETGADSCHSADHLMRLPGTINFLTAKKLKKGYPPGERTARIIDWHPKRIYKLEDLPAAQHEKKAVGAHDIGAYQAKDAYERIKPDDVALAKLKEKWLSLGQHGDVAGEYNKPGKHRRSGALFAFNIACVRAGVPDDTIAAIITDRAWGIAAPILEKTGDARRREVERSIARAHTVAAPGGRPAWRDLNKYGNAAPSLANAVLAVRSLGITCSLDLFHREVLVDYHGDVAKVEQLNGELTDDVLGAIRSLVNNRYGLDVGDANTIAAVKEIARDNAFDPVVDYLAEVQGSWDGVKRIDTWLKVYCAAPDTPFTRAVGSKHLIASVRRARLPGSKYDDILVLESPEGRNKSTAIEVLAGKENFSDQTILGVEDRVAQELLQGVWLYEIADLTDISKADVNRVKAFASRTTDRARPAYGRVVERRHRRCTLWATTNDQQYLKSQTGNRRFLPVAVGRIDLDTLRRDRDQLWAEAACAEAKGELIMLDEKLWSTASAEQERRRTIDPWEDILANIPETVDIGAIEGPTRIVHCTDDQERVASADVLTFVLAVPVKMQTTAHGQRLAIIMERLGWQRPAGGTQRVGDKVARGYWRPLPGRFV